MISVSTDMIFSAVICSLLLGALSALIYSVTLAFITLFLAALRRLLRAKGGGQKTRAATGAVDFILTLWCGALYVLVLYAFTDGVFYLCTLISLLIGFFSVRKILSACRTACERLKQKKTNILR